jgi:PAS domain S-box-containing protein
MRGTALVTGIDAEHVKFSGILQDITPLKQAAIVLRESDIRLRLTVEGFGDGAWEMNVQTREIFFSPDYKAMLWYRDEEFSNEIEMWQAHVYPDDVDGVHHATLAYLGNIVSMAAIEYRMRCKNGDYKWVLNRALVTARDADGKPLIIKGLKTDISELKKIQEVLDVSIRWLSIIIANFQDGLVLEDESRNIVLVNEAFCNLLHVPVSPG